jgi:hypothetical protein
LFFCLVCIGWLAGGGEGEGVDAGMAREEDNRGEELVELEGSTIRIDV